MFKKKWRINKHPNRPKQGIKSNKEKQLQNIVPEPTVYNMALVSRLSHTIEMDSHMKGNGLGLDCLGSPKAFPLNSYVIVHKLHNSQAWSLQNLDTNATTSRAVRIYKLFKLCFSTQYTLGVLN